MESKFIRILSIVATITAVCMYVAYIDQIQKTWGDATGPWLQPLVAGINCTLWVANAPGIFLGFLAAYSAAF